MAEGSSKYFPIKTATSCKTKWAWSTLRLNDGTTSSCCRASSSVIGENFDDFHNTEKKLAARQIMLDGQWPGDGCESCESVEAAGGFSDRQFQNQIPDIYPVELDRDPTAVAVSPAILEVFFSNTCNLKCIYCRPQSSSAIQAENTRFGGSILSQHKFEYVDNQYQSLVPKFWQWFRQHSKTLQRLHLLGGEPFLQKDVIRVVEYLGQNPHPDLELSIITNLSIPTAQLGTALKSISNTVKSQSLKRVDIQASVESWGAEQEYVRHGFDSSLFETNMQSLISMDSFRIGLLSTVNSLSINSMPDLCHRYLDWKQSHPVFWYMSMVGPEDSVFSPLIFDYSVYKSAVDTMFQLLPSETWDDRVTHDTFAGIVAVLEKNCYNNIEKQHRLAKYLDENDRRRGSDWKTTFPWLVKVMEKNNVV